VGVVKGRACVHDRRLQAACQCQDLDGPLTLDAGSPDITGSGQANHRFHRQLGAQLIHVEHQVVVPGVVPINPINKLDERVPFPVGLLQNLVRLLFPVAFL